VSHADRGVAGVHSPKKFFYDFRLVARRLDAGGFRNQLWHGHDLPEKAASRQINFAEVLQAGLDRAFHPFNELLSRSCRCEAVGPFGTRRDRAFTGAAKRFLGRKEKKRHLRAA
jgi:hypothetical protein